MSWGDGVAAAAAFVTTRDPVVEEVAREATHAVSLLGERPFGTRNLDFGAAMVDAVASLGVSYVPDPTNPYAAISAAANAVDTIYYPRQTLEKRAGDCDDMSVLLAAL